MAKSFSKYVLVASLLSLGLFLSWLTSTDATFNPATFESSPLELEVAPLTEAVTLAQYRDNANSISTLFVESHDEKYVVGIDSKELNIKPSDDPFEVFAELGARREFNPSIPRTSIPIDQLLPAGPNGKRHIGIGTNFPEHAAEANSSSVFNFPKFGTATPARTTVQSPPNSLLDYEVELCMRFDRPIRSLSDFDVAIKGVFVCADFTDRIALIKLANPDNLDSGYGFSDAKSGVGYYPTGPLLVIPNDWQRFIDETRMTTELNGEPRQDARGREMTKDFRQLTQMVLNDTQTARFSYNGEFFKLTGSDQIEADMTLMSGTSEGVIFTPPARHDYIEIFLAYLLQGGPFSDQPLKKFAVAKFIESEASSGHFLQPNDQVVYAASRLGDIIVTVTE